MATIEFLLLANHAEVQNGLLYVSGAGWSDMFQQPPGPEGQFAPNHFGIGASISVPWDETNQPHHLVILILREEDSSELARVETDIEVGRPPAYLLEPTSVRSSGSGQTWCSPSKACTGL